MVVALWSQDLSRCNVVLLPRDGGGSNSWLVLTVQGSARKSCAEIPGRNSCGALSALHVEYNPIEHRLFPHLTRACQGVIFSSVELVKDLMSKATMKTGLEVEVTILE